MIRKLYIEKPSVAWLTPWSVFHGKLYGAREDRHALSWSRCHYDSPRVSLFIVTPDGGAWRALSPSLGWRSPLVATIEEAKAAAEAKLQEVVR